MSRFSDALDEVMEDIGNNAWPNIEVLAEYIAKTIVEKQEALRAEVHIRTAYPLQRWTPISGRPTQEVYGLLAQAIATKEYSSRLSGWEVAHISPCPSPQHTVPPFARLPAHEQA